ncbi:MAG TPA: hypothetical protein VGR40_09600, partial [Candidatus Binatus sp.]|nr:hypothetical protein [Candidatus Binatus sp.]
MKTRLCLGLSIFVVTSLAIFASQQGASAQDENAVVGRDSRSPHIFVRGGTKSTNKNLIDHGGAVLPTSHVYALYWG